MLPCVLFQNTFNKHFCFIGSTPAPQDRSKLGKFKIEYTILDFGVGNQQLFELGQMETSERRLPWMGLDMIGNAGWRWRGIC